MTATAAERHGLQQAIAKALEKEAKANGSFVDPSKPKYVVTYVGVYVIAGKHHKISNTNLEAFKLAVEKIKSAFPKLPVTLFEFTEEK